MALSNSISNIIGTRIPQWIIRQINTRAAQGSLNSRNNENLKYLSNKTAWVRTVSSVNLKRETQDFKYFKEVDPQIQNPEDLAKRYVLFAGTSKYSGLTQTALPQYELRSGFGVEGSYGLMGKNEIQGFGYRPMMGITSVAIETQGRLGSVRQATVEFKCWTKNQLDIADALYFKLGYTMFLEWGHTYYYDSEKQTVESSEQWSIDPFTPISNNEFSKEDIFRKININSRKSCGNYDAMLGIVTNYNFSYNQDGGFDCMIRLTSLGYLGDSIKINNPSPIVGILKDEILEYKKTLDILSQPPLDGNLPDDYDPQKEKEKLDRLADQNGNIPNYPPNIELGQNARYNLIINKGVIGDVLLIKKLNGYLPLNSDFSSKVKIKIDIDAILEILRQQNTFLQYIDKWSSGGYRNFESSYKGKSGSNYFIKISVDQNVRSKKDSNLSNLVKEKLPDNVIPNTDENLGELTNYTIVNNLINIDTISSIFLVTDFANNLFPKFVRNEEFSFYSPGYGSALAAGIFIDDIEYLGKNNNFPNKPIRFKVRGKIPITLDANVYVTNLLNKNSLKFIDPQTYTITYNDYYIDFSLEFNDTDLIKFFTEDVSSLDQPPNFVNEEAILNQEIQNQIEQETLENQKKDLEVLKTQILESINTQSSLELILRTIQVRTLNKAIFKNPDKPDLDIGNTVYEFKFDKKFRDQIFSNGIYTDIIQDLVDKKSPQSNNDRDTLLSYAKFGFATSLLGSEEDLFTSLNELKGKEVDYQDLLASYAIPYKINQELVNGIQTNHPVYIPFGLLLMILNHVGGIYDTKKGENQTKDKKGNFQKPLIYLDYNPKLNFFLTNEQHLSTDPFRILIPIEGRDGSYSKLFSDSVLTKNRTEIQGVENTETYPLFKDDRLSFGLPKIKDEIAYRGKTMNILVSIDHILNIVRSNSTSDERNSVYLKPFVEEILASINKSLGDFNSFRLAYNDKANTFHIVDDQLVPGLPDDVLLREENRTEIPIVGLGSVTKNLELKTQISSRLGNMIAISANSSPQDQVQSSTNGDTFGFFNLNFEDRYIPRRTEGQSTKPSNLNGEIISAIQFNKTIEDFYSSIYASPSDVPQATSYYIEKMSRVKNDNTASRSSALIPVGINLTMEGLGGLRMGQAFTVTDNLLPYSFNKSEFPLGFVIVGLRHTIQNNLWETSATTNILPIKDRTVFNLAAEQARVSKETFKSDFYKSEGYTAKTSVVPNANNLRVELTKLGYAEKEREISSWGDISDKLSNAAKQLFAYIKSNSTTSKIAITITGGNDVYHQTKLDYISDHIYGKGLDFTISPNNEESVDAISQAIQDFRIKNPGLLDFDNEYKKPSEQATGKHFHIFVS